MKVQGLSSPNSIEKNYKRQSSHLIIIVISLATLSIYMFFQIGSIQTQFAVAQQQPSQGNLTLSENQRLLNGVSFQIDKVTFSHHMASVNGIQMHYVIGGHGDPLILLHGWPQTWYEWHHIMPILAESYTVIAPDLRGLGDSSKPTIGYDGATTAEDLYQLVSKLGSNKIFLVAHDIGAQTAFSFAAAHLNNVSKLVIMDYIFAGFLPPAFGQNGPWWFSFHQTPDLPEVLVQGKERQYLSWFYKELAYNPEAITQEDIDEFVSHYAAPGGMKAGFEYYRAFPIDAIQNVEIVNKSKLQTPVLVLAGDYYPTFGGDVPGNPALEAIKSLAVNVSGSVVPLSGHWIPEEQPKFVVEQIFKFFRNGTNISK
jgi:pimeloyl-ACP methyl ester carboxylesterase